MSKVTKVIVLCPKGRRQSVNLTANSSILQILEEVCQKQKLNPDDFDICHYKKPLDLSLPVRFANLANNAQLELQPAKTARKDCLVTVGLQLESGERILQDFVPSTSVWDVVEQCLNKKSDRPNLDKKGEPVCIYMRQKLIGDAMKETTLRSLGLIKGSAIIRLLYRNPDDLSDQAHVSSLLTKPLKETLPEPSNNEMEWNSSNSENFEISVPADISSLSTPKLNESKPKLEVKEDKVTGTQNALEREDTMIADMNNQENERASQMHIEKKIELNVINMEEDNTKDIGAIHYIGGRHAVLYSLNDITDVKKADLPDEFFALTIEDVKFLMEEFKKTRVELDNQPLLTKELRNRQMLQKMGRFKQTVIRIYFPERLVLQAVFEAQESVHDVCDFIRNYLEDKSLNFYLYTTPPKEKKDPVKTLIESMLIPAAVIYFGCDQQHSSYLTNSLRDKISDPRAASMAAYESRKQAICETEEMSSVEMATPVADAIQDDYKLPGPSFSQPSSSTVQTTEKIPKWLKMSRK